MKKIYICLGLLICTSIYLNSQILSIQFLNIRNNKGVFRIGLFPDELSYKNGDPTYYLTVPKFDAINGELTVKYNDIIPGIYGIAVLDDENENDKTDYGYILPVEGFGFSNYYIHTLFIPKFDDFKFTFEKEDLTVKVKLKYL